jgi:hypothetical protein
MKHRNIVRPGVQYFQAVCQIRSLHVLSMAYVSLKDLYAMDKRTALTDPMR